VAETKKSEVEPTADAAPAQRAQIQIDDSKALALYANFFRVIGTPEEVIVDFGLNPPPPATPSQAIPVTQRIIINFYTAKRMVQALQVAIQRHESLFGVLETDVQKRARAGSAPVRAPGQ